MSRIVVVSNRVSSVATGTPAAGGLAVAVVDALQGDRGLWVGWNGEVRNTERACEVEESHCGAMSTLAWPLSSQSYAGFYRGFANEVVWPVFHGRTDRMRFRTEHFSAYLHVNQMFASHLAEHVQPDDVIWVHDYHFMHLASYCRDLGLNNQIGFFLHIPFPEPENLKAIPVHNSIVKALFKYDLIGFQTEKDQHALQSYIQTDRSEHTAFGQDPVAHQLPKMGVYPIGIDCNQTLSQVQNSQKSSLSEESVGQCGETKTIISVDRLDYTKGLLERLESYDQFLSSNSDWQGRVSLMQISPISRSDVLGYEEIRREVERLVARVNGTWGTPGWVPVNYMNRSFERAALLGLLRASHVGLVTSLCDGMNLVAKEYVMVQEASDPGVLVLSEFAGAANELDVGAILINPYDTVATAQAIHRALTMPLDERKERYSAMLDVLRQNDLLAWKNNFLYDLYACGAQVIHE